MIPELISRVFLARNKTHLAHLLSKSYSEHMALDEFYNGVIPAMDDLVECYIGAFGDDIKDLPVSKAGSDGMVEFLRDESDWLEVNRNEIANESQAVGNLVDTLNAVYLKAIYKLENLK